MHESTTYQAILDEGEERGRMRQARKMILLQGRTTFGRAGKKIEAVLEGISDIDRLEKMYIALLDEASSAQVFAVK